MKRTRPRSLTAHSTVRVRSCSARFAHCSASQRVGRFAHAPASVAEGRRTRRTKPSTTLPQSAPHHVRKAGLIRALGHGGGRILFRHSARHHTPRGSGCKQRCLAGMNAWRARVIPTLWPRPPRRQHGTAAVEIRCGDSALRSVLWLGRIACRMQTAGLCACVCVCVRACVHGAGGVDAEPQCRSGRQASPSRLVTAAASLRNPPRSRPVARRPFLLRLHRPKFQQRQVAFVTSTVRVVVRTRVRCTST